MPFFVFDKLLKCFPEKYVMLLIEVGRPLPTLWSELTSLSFPLAANCWMMGIVDSR